MSTKAAAKKIQKLRQRLSENPHDPQARLDLGKTFFLNSQFDEAVNCYRALLKQDSRNASAHYNLAVALLAQKKTQEAKAAFQKVLEIDPNNEMAQEELSKLISFP